MQAVSKSELGPDDKMFLANLDIDETESQNLAAEHPEVVEELRLIQEQYSQSIETETSKQTERPGEPDA